MRPFGSVAIARWHVFHPGKRRGEVVVGDGDVSVATDDHRAIRLERPETLDGLAWARAVEHEIAGDRDPVGAMTLDIGKGGVERANVAVDVTKDGESHGHQRNAPSGGMMNEIVASQHVSPSTLATALPRPKRLPSLSMVTSRLSRSPGWTTRLKRHSSMPAK